MKKILIICDVYPPSFAPRMGYLVKYMREWGWTADIVTRGMDGDVSFQSLLGNERVLRVQGSMVQLRSFKSKIYRLFTLKKYHKKNANIISHKIIHSLNPIDYDLILCSTAHRTYILDAAQQVAQSWKKKWIADLRDLDEQKPYFPKKNDDFVSFLVNKFEEDFHRFVIKKRNSAFRAAHSLISISPWHVNEIKRYNQNSYLIYNGFDPVTYFPSKIINKKSFNITYTGTVHAGRHDPELLFLATKKLKEIGTIDVDKFRIQFYVPKNWRKNITNHPAYPDVKEFVHFFDYIDTSEVPKLLNESSVLLLLSNRLEHNGPKGLISTTKYFEYLAVEKPILCVRSDEDLLEASIKIANAGISARTVDETYDFLLEKWNEWKETGFTSVEINRAYTQQFSRRLQAKQFVELFNKMKNC